MWLSLSLSLLCIVLTKKLNVFLWWKHTTFPGCNGLFIAFYFKLMIVYNKEQNEYLATRVI